MESKTDLTNVLQLTNNGLWSDAHFMLEIEEFLSKAGVDFVEYGNLSGSSFEFSNDFFFLWPSLDLLR